MDEWMVDEEMDQGVDWAGVVLGPALQEEAGLFPWRYLSLRVISEHLRRSGPRS